MHRIRGSRGSHAAPDARPSPEARLWTKQTHQGRGPPESAVAHRLVASPRDALLAPPIAGCAASEQPVVCPINETQPIPCLRWSPNLQTLQTLTEGLPTLRTAAVPEPVYRIATTCAVSRPVYASASNEAPQRKPNQHHKPPWHSQHDQSFRNKIPPRNE